METNKIATTEELFGGNFGNTLTTEELFGNTVTTEELFGTNQVLPKTESLKVKSNALYAPDIEDLTADSATDVPSPSTITSDMGSAYDTWKRGWEMVTKPTPESEYKLTPTDYAKLGLSVAMPFTIPFTRPSGQAVEQTLKSASRMGIGMGEFAGQLVDLTFEPEPYKKAEKTGTILSGLANFIGERTGLKDIAESLVNEGKLIPDNFKHLKLSWQTDPVGSMIAILPFVKGGIRSVVKTAKEIKGTVKSEDLGFTPKEEPVSPQKKEGAVFSNRKQYLDEEKYDPRFLKTEDVGDTYFFDETGNIRTRWDVGNEIPDVNVKIVKQMDISPAEQALTTLHVADRHPFMKSPIEISIKATQDTNHAIRQQLNKLEDIFNESEGKPLWGLAQRKSSSLRDIDKMIEGKVPIPENLKGFIENTQSYLEDMRQRVITKKKSDVLQHLSPKQKEYYKYLQEGGGKPKYVRDGTVRAVGEIKNQFAELERWGLEDYFPRLMKGQYYYLSENGHILAIGETPKQAKFNLIEKIEIEPDLRGQTVYFVNGLKAMLNARHTLNPELRGTLEAVGTSLSRKSFFGLINKIEKLIDSEIVEAGVTNVEGIKVDLSGIAKTQSREKFAGNLLKRETELRGQEQDPFKTLSAYTMAVERHLGLSNAKKLLIDFEESLPPHMENAKAYIKKLRENMLGHYDWANKWTDQIIGRRLGVKPFLLSRYLQKGQGAVANFKLGFAPVKALLNYIDATSSTLTKTGLKHWANGLRILRKQEGKNLVGEIGHLAGLEESFAYSHRIKSPDVNILKPMGLYQFAELKGRTQSLAAGYSQGLEIYGGDITKAKQHAVDIARLTQGLYDVAAKPVAVRSPLVATAYQFKQFVNNKIRFLSGLTPEQLSFYIPFLISLYGTRGVWLTLKSIVGVTLISDLLGNIGEKTNEELNKKYPHLHRGIFGLAGYDVSAPGTVQLPTQVRDWMGPLYNDLFKTGNMIINGLKNDGWTDEEIAQYINQVAPVGYNIYKGLQLAQSGEIRRGDRLMYRGKPIESIYNFLGGRTVEQSRESDTTIFENWLKKRQNEKYEVLADKILSSKTNEEFAENLKSAIKLKEIMNQDEWNNFISGLKKRWIENQLTQRERTFKTLPRNIKRRELRGD